MWTECLILSQHRLTRYTFKYVNLSLYMAFYLHHVEFLCLLFSIEKKKKEILDKPHSTVQK